MLQFSEFRKEQYLFQFFLGPYTPVMDHGIGELLPANVMDIV
jgi:hypothetical protein